MPHAGMPVAFRLPRGGCAQVPVRNRLGCVPPTDMGAVRELIPGREGHSDLVGQVAEAMGAAQAELWPVHGRLKTRLRAEEMYGRAAGAALGQRYQTSDSEAPQRCPKTTVGTGLGKDLDDVGERIGGSAVGESRAIQG